MYFKNFKISVILIILAMVFSGCSTLKNLDNKAGELLKIIGQEEKTEVIPSEEKNPEEEIKLNLDTKEITQEQIKKIDKFLEKNNLNRYGDLEGTMYMGGTPLFNESTGESIDRLEYLIEKHPDLVNKAIIE